MRRCRLRAAEFLLSAKSTSPNHVTAVDELHSLAWSSKVGRTAGKYCRLAWDIVDVFRVPHCTSTCIYSPSSVVLSHLEQTSHCGYPRLLSAKYSKSCIIPRTFLHLTTHVALCVNKKNCAAGLRRADINSKKHASTCKGHKPRMGHWHKEGASAMSPYNVSFPKNRSMLHPRPTSSKSSRTTTPTMSCLPTTTASEASN